MASWADYVSLFLTISVFSAIIYVALLFNRHTSAAVQSTKEKLKSKGLEISDEGLSVKGTTKLANREHYMDATQRGIMKALSASQTGKSAVDPPSTNGTDKAVKQSRFSRLRHRAKDEPQNGHSS